MILMVKDVRIVPQARHHNFEAMNAIFRQAICFHRICVNRESLHEHTRWLICAFEITELHLCNEKNPFETTKVM